MFLLFSVMTESSTVDANMNNIDNINKYDLFQNCIVVIRKKVDGYKTLKTETKLTILENLNKVLDLFKELLDCYVAEWDDVDRYKDDNIKLKAELTNLKSKITALGTEWLPNKLTYADKVKLPRIQVDDSSVFIFPFEDNKSTLIFLRSMSFLKLVFVTLNY